MARTRSHSLARAIAFFGALAFAIAIPNALVVSLTAKTAGAATPTVISIQFDDGVASQYQARPWLAARGLPATFFINSGTRPPSFNSLSWAQLHDLANDGNEIGGHTVDHTDLTTVSATEARAEVCDDRNTLVAQGFNVRSFAYPYGHGSPAIESIVQSCGYSSARGVSGINSTAIAPDDCDGCPYAETIPPQDPFDTRTPENVQNTYTVAQIESFVTQAEQHGGGWVQLVFHEICPENDPACDQYGITATKLQSVLDFVAGRVAQGDIVKTVGDVIADGPVQPPPTGPNLVKNPSFETPAGATAVPDCWQQGAAGTNTATWSHTSDAHTGSFAEKVSISAYTNGDRKIVQRQDSGACAPAITAGHTYRLSEWYLGSAPAFTIYTRNAAGAWIFCQQSATFPATFVWAQATFDWTQPANSANGCGSSTGYVPTAISFGLALARAGGLTVDDASLIDLNPTPPPPDTTPPVTTIACNGVTCAGSFAGSASVSLAATDTGGSGVAVTRYTRNGTNPTKTGAGGTTYAAPFTVSATTTVKFASWDVAGIAEAVHTQVVTIGAAQPNLVKNPSFETPAGATAVPDCWQQGAAGTNTATWSHTSDAHSGSFAEKVTITALTNGDRKIVQRQDAGACAPAINASHRYQLREWYKGTGNISFTIFTRNAAGAWIFCQQTATVPAASAWTQATFMWTQPATSANGCGKNTGYVPTAISFGLSLSSVGSLTVDDASLSDVGAA